MSDNTGLIEMRDNLRKASDIIDEVLELEKREEDGVDVEEEYETLMGKFIMIMIKTSKIAENL
ncbi:hypothetical protein QTH27_12825 [Clostridium perfringens]|nr:hypothetical protein [Clostridium perfringens]